MFLFKHVSQRSNNLVYAGSQSERLLQYLLPYTLINQIRRNNRGKNRLQKGHVCGGFCFGFMGFVCYVPVIQNCTGNILQWQACYTEKQINHVVCNSFQSHIREMKQDKKEFGKVGGEERHVQYRIVSKYGFCRNFD